jgi:hypothetical protein
VHQPARRAGTRRACRTARMCPIRVPRGSWGPWSHPSRPSRRARPTLRVCAPPRSRLRRAAVPAVQPSPQSSRPRSLAAVVAPPHPRRYEDPRRPAEGRHACSGGETGPLSATSGEGERPPCGSSGDGDGQRGAAVRLQGGGPAASPGDAAVVGPGGGSGGDHGRDLCRCGGATVADGAAGALTRSEECSAASIATLPSAESCDLHAASSAGWVGGAAESGERRPAEGDPPTTCRSRRCMA